MLPKNESLAWPDEEKVRIYTKRECGVMGILRVFLDRWKDGVLRDCFNLLSRIDKVKLGCIVFIQIFLSILDLVAIALVGILGALSINGIKSSAPGNTTLKVLKILQLETASFQSQVAWLGAIAGVFLLVRTISSMFLTKRTIGFLSRRGAQISSDLVSRLFTQPLLKIQERTSQETLYACTIGVSSIALGVIATGVNVLSDLALITVIASGLFIVDPAVAVSTLIFFAILAFTLYRKMQGRASELGTREASISISTNKKMLEVINLYRENTIRNTRWRYSDEISGLRSDLAEIQAEMTYMPNISKYVLESGIVLGAVLISAFQFSTQDSAHAVASIGIFIAAGSRLAPALLRVQQGAIHMKNSLGVASPTLSLIDEFSFATTAIKTTPDFVYENFIPSVVIDEVTLHYENRSDDALKNVTLNIPAGNIVAIVGPSGAGKTSLVDVLLGAISPSSGKVLISGISPNEVIVKWPGAIAYVPQDVYIIDGTLRENITIGMSSDSETTSRIESAITLAQLSEVVGDLPNGLDTEVGENGVNLSGGQRQRIGIARALYTEPKLIVLDEATSALDADTEDKISNSVQALRVSHTLIIIAHRLSTVRNADLVVYLDNGQVLAQGSFDYVRNAIPEFDNQANLMGL
jgi:ABC-type multidrug transport system fused ATPase/permease subunit